MIAYLRLFPKTLIAGWSSGTGLSGLISGFLNLLTQLVSGLSLKFLYLILTPVGVLYLFLFIWTYRILKSQERKIEYERRMSNAGNFSIAKDSSIRETKLENIKKENEEEIKKQELKEVNEGGVEINVKNKSNENLEEVPAEQIYEGHTSNLSFEEEEKKERKSLREAEDKELENMNKANQTMSLVNFLAVMKMVGDVIINLGLIYFLQFFCVNALIVRICSKVDIKFLPIGCSENHRSYRKGKFEFINLAYQVGMFISKTFIKIVRKIQPIQIYTFFIAGINILYIVEYYTGFLTWGYFIGIGLVLGFFSGGTYAGGFYTILNSDRVDKNYKELTVNVATLFNDTGTFLSGILGFFALKYWVSSEKAFKGQELPVPDHCDS